MAKHNRNNRQTPRNPLAPNSSLRILNLGECFDTRCPHYNFSESHYHGLAYTKGKPTPDTIKQAEKVLRGVGFKGELEVEVISTLEFKKRAAGYGEWL